MVHSFWVPQLAGKTDLIPNRVNAMWIEPKQAGTYLGNCAEYCGTQHANMLLRVIAQSPEEFAQWVAAQQRPRWTRRRCAPAVNCSSQPRASTATPSAARRPQGTFGPDLTQLMTRDTIGAGRRAEHAGETARLGARSADASRRAA